jgi:predicted amidophosphoribosyltransferase
MSGPARAAASVVRAGTVVFVPATRAAVSERGFNTAEELARPLGRTLGLPVRRLLRKTRDTADQAGLGRDERALNLRGAFSSGTVEGGVVLVDDVLTTGATADACARALLDAGAEGVGVVTFARAP